MARPSAHKFAPPGTARRRGLGDGLAQAAGDFRRDGRLGGVVAEQVLDALELERARVGGLGFGGLRLGGLLLVAAGVGLLLLKNWARLASIGCGIYKIAFAMLNLAVLCLALREILAKALQGAGAVVLVILGLAGFVGAILTLAYPVLLIWFLTRPKAVLAFQP